MYFSLMICPLHDGNIVQACATLEYEYIHTYIPRTRESISYIDYTIV